MGGVRAENEHLNQILASHLTIILDTLQVVSNTFSGVKEYCRSMLEKLSDNCDFVDSVKKLAQLCEEVGEQVDEIGACLNPSPDIRSIYAALEKIHRISDAVQVEVVALPVASNAFVDTCNALRSFMRQILSSTADLETRMGNITLTNK